MKEHIIIKIPGEPKAQKRHRDRQTIVGKNGKMFTPKYDPSSADKGDFLSQIKKVAPWDPMLGPIEMNVTFAFSRPLSHYGTGKNAGVLKANAPYWHTTKPDRDNCDKFCMDAMSKTFWHDDSQVCVGKLQKIYSNSPYIEIEIIEL